MLVPVRAAADEIKKKKNRSSSPVRARVHRPSIPRENIAATRSRRTHTTVTHARRLRWRRVRDMNRGPTVAQSLPVDRYAGNCLIKPSYYCGGGGGAAAALEPQPPPPPSRRYDGGGGGYHHHGPSPYQHFQQLQQEWFGRTAYWHHHQHHQHHHNNHNHHHNQSGAAGGGGGACGPLAAADKANFAAHKHGAPLIQAAKYNRSGGGGGGGPGKKYAKKAPAEQLPVNTGLGGGGCGGGGGKKNDGGSDESSGAASENSLPRIIKPRKRRKKERKPVPPAAAAVVAQQQPLVVVVSQERVAADAAAADRPTSSPSPPPPPSPQQQQQQPTSFESQLQHPPPPTVQRPPLQLQLQLQADVVPSFDTIRLSADIKAVSLEDVSTCQCACCDPVGNVWDVGRRCFSPSLTRPEPTRRSWSGEPYTPPRQQQPQQQQQPYYAKEMSVVGLAKPENAAVRIRTHSLEVSSEIVTSHNGHRDIEIKFFTMPIGGH